MAVRMACGGGARRNPETMRAAAVRMRRAATVAVTGSRRAKGVGRGLAGARRGLTGPAGTAFHTQETGHWPNPGSVLGFRLLLPCRTTASPPTPAGPSGARVWTRAGLREEGPDALVAQGHRIAIHPFGGTSHGVTPSAAQYSRHRTVFGDRFHGCSRCRAGAGGRGRSNP